MNRDNDRQTSIILAVLGILPIVWLGLLIAPSVKQDLGLQGKGRLPAYEK